jgi:hypothetical protein
MRRRQKEEGLMATVMTVTQADLDKGAQSVEFMEGAQDLIDLVLTQNKGNLQKAANALKPYEIAQRALKNMTTDMQQNPEVAFEAMKLMLDFTRTAHQDVAIDIQDIWRVEREASKVLTAATSAPRKYTHNGGGVERLPFYRAAIEMVRGYLATGYAFIWTDTNWYGNDQERVFRHEVCTRTRKNASPIETQHIHHIATELYFNSIAEVPKDTA